MSQIKNFPLNFLFLTFEREILKPGLLHLYRQGSAPDGEGTGIRMLAEARYFFPLQIIGSGGLLSPLCKEHQELLPSHKETGACS
jgi:hypothetical protein